MMGLAVVASRVILIRRRSRIDIGLKQDLDTQEICTDMVTEESNMTPRLRAESDGEIVTLEGMRRAASETLESCLTSESEMSKRAEWCKE